MIDLFVVRIALRHSSRPRESRPTSFLLQEEQHGRRAPNGFVLPPRRTGQRSINHFLNRTSSEERPASSRPLLSGTLVREEFEIFDLIQA